MDLSMMDFDGSDWRGLKMGKTEEYSSVSSTKQMLRSSSSDGQNMLRFSLTDSKNEDFGLHNHTSSGYCTNTGSGGGLITGVRGPFTPSQWMELEHQALIYKYMLSNVPVPSNLLFPIKKALDSAGFSIGPLRPNTYGWGAFHLGFSSNIDPEPGRCRRTDGKKWRCSRDACPDQKYCERHINRGRHRSRKPVEGHYGHSVSTPTATSAKSVPVAAASLSSAVVVPGGSGASGLGISHQTQLKSLQHCGINPGDSSLHFNWNFVNKDSERERNQATTDFSMFSSNLNLKINQSPIEKQQNPYNEPIRSQFGLVFSDSLLNPMHKTSSEALNERENSLPAHQFIDEWSKTQLSISTDLHINEHNNKQANWVPISWGTSMGGPLGEALHNANQNISNECNNNIGLVSSPNGPFQRMAFGSQTNSSAGSSPRGVSTSLAQLL